MEAHMRTLKIVLVISAVVMLTGCIEIVHFVDRQDGQLQARYRVTFSKSVIDFLEQFGEQSDMESERPSQREIEKELQEGVQQLRTAMPEGINSEIATINTDTDFGVDVTVARDSDDQSGSADARAAARWVPRRSNGELVVPLFPADEEPPGAGGSGPGGSGGSDSGDSDSGGSAEQGSLSQQGGDAVLAGRKYRVLVSSSVVPESPEFLLRKQGRQSGESPRRLTAIRFQDVYLVEIPMSVWTSSNRAALVVRSKGGVE
jgi:hypothetical protein